MAAELRALVDVYSCDWDFLQSYIQPSPSMYHDASTGRAEDDAPKEKEKPYVAQKQTSSVQKLGNMLDLRWCSMDRDVIEQVRTY